jgi:hypothetical protein
MIVNDNVSWLLLISFTGSKLRMFIYPNLLHVLFFLMYFFPIFIAVIHHHHHHHQHHHFFIIICKAVEMWQMSIYRTRYYFVHHLLLYLLINLFIKCHIVRVHSYIFFLLQLNIFLCIKSYILLLVIHLFLFLYFLRTDRKHCAAHSI